MCPDKSGAHRFFLEDHFEKEWIVLKKLNLLNVILSFSKIGAIGFGGGAALVPIIESEVVEKNKWLDREQFDVCVAAASISPASLPVSITAVWNTKYSLFSSYAYALPGPMIYLVLLTGFSMIGQAGIKYIEYASAGILIFVLLIIYKFIRKNYLHSVSIGIKMRHIIILCASFALYSGVAVRRLIASLFSINIDQLPGTIFAITMLDLIIILFFVACFIGTSRSKIKIGATILVSGLFALSKGKMDILSEWSTYILLLMIAMTIASIAYDVVKNKNKSTNEKYVVNLRSLRNVLFFLMVAAGLTTIAFFASGNAIAWDFAFKGVTSSLTSFGGGEVYYAIAHDWFVETDYIPGIREFYMTRILGIAGAMPGPVIVSILAGVGFALGSSLGGAALGWIFGLVGASMAITATAIGACSLFTVFELLKENPRLKLIIKYIIPLVCGVLISVAFTLSLRSAEVIARSIHIHMLLSFGAVIVIFCLMVFAHLKYRINDMVLFFIGGLGMLAFLGLLSNLM